MLKKSLQTILFCPTVEHHGPTARRTLTNSAHVCIGPSNLFRPWGRSHRQKGRQSLPLSPFFVYRLLRSLLRAFLLYALDLFLHQWIFDKAPRVFSKVLIISALVQIHFASC
jgi:hypothetical protein